MTDYYIGLMSGTSLDGVDGVLVDFGAVVPRVLAHVQAGFDAALRAELLALNSRCDDELHRAALAGQQVALVYAQVVHSLLAQAGSWGLGVGDICAIGAHGQTVRHQPNWHKGSDGGSASIGYSLQLNCPAWLAELTKITVVADFRSRDLAAGGQGAPLVPAFHRQVFGQVGCAVAVLNLGGMANLSVLPGDADAPVLGFDCGPGNALMDAWCLRQTGRPFDADGAWAASGKCLPGLLALLRAEYYFDQAPPKSTGRDLFSLTWLHNKLQAFTGERASDIQATLTELTASTCVDSVKRYASASRSLVVCGGGALNTYLMKRLQAGLPGVLVSSSAQHGLAPLQVEAAAFAWLARQAMQRQPGNLPSATGAVGSRVLGAIYPS